MIKSMTGFGRGKYEKDGRTYTVEIKSVNHKYSDINVRFPRFLNSVEDTIRKAGGRLLNAIQVFDVYEGEHVAEGKKSIAYNLLFMAEDRTLTDEEVMKVFNQIIEKVVSVHKAEVRDK